MKKTLHPLLQTSVFFCAFSAYIAAQTDFTGNNSLELPRPGAHTLRILSPTQLELVRINSKEPNPARVDSWDFFDTNNVYQEPALSEFTVTINGTPVAVQSVGFKRRPLYAPLRVRDLRISNSIYLTLATPVADGQTVEVTNPGGNLWPAGMNFIATMDPLRYSPVIHVNQEGYVPGFPKEAMIGYYLGNQGEMDISAGPGFKLVDAVSGAEVYTGTLTPRIDTGFTYTPTPYQKVLEADFSSFTTPGKYKLKVPGLGASVEFAIDEGIAMCFARTYAQGLYHQRCGMAKTLPYSRFTHSACHTAAAEIPLPESSFAFTWNTVAAANANYAGNERHTAPRLDSAAAQLYPIQMTGTLDVSGGHHDAGDYSKYTINSAALIHYLTFAADAFPNAGDLDNLGLPESSDGKSDLLQEAKWEADYLAKLQDTDGGFFFLVYPKTRKYEGDVLPDQGDSQVVWPKNTAATAAAVAALAELGSSPRFRQQYPAEAANYMAKATAGWNFLISAINTHGKDGAYQKITHYGDVFMHDDELVWAAAAMFAATGDPVYQNKMMEWMPDPNSSDTRRWSWWRCFEGYGSAMRTYAFASRSGRLTAGQLNAAYLLKCENELKAAGNDQINRAAASAYGSSLPFQDKSWVQAGWYFSNDKGFDIAVAYQLNPESGSLPAIVSNMNYEAGTNPHNITLITGLGWRRQSEIVSQYAQNDRRFLPPSGICLGNMQTGFQWLNTYGTELGQLNYPKDSTSTNRHPLYDRWADTFNTTTEFVINDLAMGLGNLAFLAGQTTTRNQTWKSAIGIISVPTTPVPCGSNVTATLAVAGMDLSTARVVWEARDQTPMIGNTFTFSPVHPGQQWVEAEATWPDGRRVSAAGYFTATNNSPGAGVEYAADADTIALYHFTGNYNDSSSNGYHLIPVGNVTLVNDNLGWMVNPSGEVARFTGLGDKLSVSIPDSAVMPGAAAVPVTVEAWIYPQSYFAYGNDDSPIIELSQNHDARFGIVDGKWNNPKNPDFSAANTTLLTAAQWNSNVQFYTWQHVQITFDSAGTVKFYLDGVLLASDVVPQNYSRSSNWTLTLGNFEGDIDELRISKVVRPVNVVSEDEFTVDSDTVALYHFNGNYNDSARNGYHLTAAGGTVRTSSNLSWMQTPAGEVVRFSDAGDTLSVAIPDSALQPGPDATAITLETRIYPRAYKAYSVDNLPVIYLYQNWDTLLGVQDRKWSDTPHVPTVFGATATVVTNSQWSNAVQMNVWSKLKITFATDGTVSCFIDDVQIGTAGISLNTGRTNDWILTLGNFDGDIDEVRISKVVRDNTSPPAVSSSSDSDNDGLPDWWESAYFGSDTGADPDAETANGLNSNREAYIAGFDPNDRAAGFRIIRSSLPKPAGPAFDLVTVVGRVYTICYNDDPISAPVWKIAETVTGTGWLLQWQDDGGHTDPDPSAAQNRFYRVSVDLAP